MAKSSGATTSIQTKFYFSTVFLTAAPTYAQLTTGTGTFMATNIIKDVVEPGDLGSEAAIVRYTPFGEDTEKTLAGVASLPEWDFTIVLDESDTVHAAIRAAANGTKCSIAAVTDTGASEKTVDYILGEIAAQAKVFSAGEATRLRVSIAMSQKPTIIAQA